MAISENEDSLLSIDDIIDPELQQSASVKVLTFKWPSGRTDVQAPKGKEDILPLKNVSTILIFVCTRTDD